MASEARCFAAAALALAAGPAAAQALNITPAPESGVASLMRRVETTPVAREASDGAVRSGQVLSNGRTFVAEPGQRLEFERSLAGSVIFIIGPRERPAFPRSSTGAVVLSPGTRVELGDLRLPYMRVPVTAPAGAPLDVDALVGRRPRIGIFNALFQVPGAPRRGDSGETAVASAASSTRPPAAPSMAVAAVAPVEDRVVLMLPLPPAPVTDRSFVAFVPPVEDRTVLALPLPPAPVVDRSFVAFVAPVEDREVLVLPLPPAPVVEKSVLARTAPVEERAVVALARIEEPAPALKIVPQEVALVAPKALTPYQRKDVEPDASIRVSAAPVVAPVIIPSRAPAEPRTEAVAQPPVKLAAVQKRMPRILLDHKGAIFHM